MAKLASGTHDPDNPTWWKIRNPKYSQLVDGMNSSNAAERKCTVTAIYPDGQKHTLKVHAKSLFSAVFAFNSEAVSRAALGIPRPKLDTTFEVRLPDGRRFQTTFQKAMEWGNQKADEWARRRSFKHRPLGPAFTGASSFLPPTA